MSTLTVPHALLNPGCDSAGSVHPAHGRLVLALEMAEQAARELLTVLDGHDCDHHSDLDRTGGECLACQLWDDATGLMWCLERATGIADDVMDAPTGFRRQDRPAILRRFEAEYRRHMRRAVDSKAR